MRIASLENYLPTVGEGSIQKEFFIYLLFIARIDYTIQCFEALVNLNYLKIIKIVKIAARFLDPNL